MTSQKLHCPCGHSWDSTDPNPPADLRAACPVCAGGVQATPGLKAASHPTARDSGPGGPELKPGDELAGFEIIRPLNRGGMGVVYKARQRGLDRLVALKVVAPERLTGKDQAEYIERFRREARAAALLNHPNIVTVYATDLDGPRPYFAMEFVEGVDLYKLVKQAGPLNVLDSAEYVRQAALGLQHAFEKGLTHRDIKPHNLMVTPSPLGPATSSASGSRKVPVVKILDMGLARLDNDPALDEGLTMADAILGTPDFLAPEQAEDSRNVDTRADLYSLGATWFYLLTGEVPFPGTSLMQKLRKQLTQPTPLVSELRADVPPVVVALIRKLMDRDPAKRFQTPAELADALADFLRDPTATPDWMADAEDGPKVVEAHPGGVTALALNGDGKLLFTGGDDQKLRVWDARAMTPVQELSGDVGPVSGVAVTGTGKWGASCAVRLMATDMAVQLWDLKTGVERLRLRGPKDSVVCVAIAPDGRRVAAGDRDGVVHVWTLDPPGVRPLALAGHAGTVTGVAFAGDGGIVLSVGLDGTLRLWDVATRKGEVALMGDAGAVRGVAWAKATGTVALAGDRLVLWDPEGQARTLAGHEGGCLGVAFSADGSLLVSGGRDKAVRLWRTADGSEVTAFEGHDGPVRAVAFGADRRHVYSAGADGTVRRWPVWSVAGALGSGVRAKTDSKVQAAS